MICVCGMRGYQEEGHHGSYHRHLGNDYGDDDRDDDDDDDDGGMVGMSM